MKNTYNLFAALLLAANTPQFSLANEAKSESMEKILKLSEIVAPPLRPLTGWTSTMPFYNHTCPEASEIKLYSDGMQVFSSQDCKHFFVSLPTTKKVELKKLNTYVTLEQCDDMRSLKEEQSKQLRELESTLFNESINATKGAEFVSNLEKRIAEKTASLEKLEKVYNAPGSIIALKLS